MTQVPFSFCGRLEEAVRILRALGYNGVELLLRKPEDIDVAELELLLAKHEAELSAIGTGLTHVRVLWLR